MRRRLNKDKRRVSRRTIAQNLILFHRGVPVIARLLNLSPGGALIETTEHLRVSAEIIIVLYLPDRTPLTLTARVRFSREGIGAGIEFIRLTPLQRRRIALLINSPEPKGAQVL
jgi:hypothetical protein